MADPVTYCSWAVESLCMTQSEWATWSQAILTVVTFGVALWRQEAARAESEVHRKSDTLERKLERDAAAHQRALAFAVNVRGELDELHSIATIVQTYEMKSPGKTFKEASSFLDVRKRAMEAAELLGASTKVLRAVNAANIFYAEFRMYSHKAAYDQADIEFLRKSGTEIEPIAKRAIDAIDVFLAEVIAAE